MRVFVLFVIAASIVACRDKSVTTAPVASAASTVSAAHVASPSSRLANCPTTVSGSTTTLRDIDNGIEIVVIATAQDAIADIRARAAALVVAARDPSLQDKHGSGSGGGGGGASGGSGGRCPIIMKRTVVEAHDVSGGSAITVTARVPEQVDWLRRETRERQDEIAVTAK
jgi:hypothetical protein